MRALWKHARYVIGDNAVTFGAFLLFAGSLLYFGAHRFHSDDFGGSASFTYGNFHRLESERTHLVQHGVERKMSIDSIEDADGNLAEGAGGLRGTRI
jgi:hypothetical protein